MRVLIAGGSGLIGQALTRALLAHGHDVQLLVRRAPASRSDGAREHGWEPARRLLPTDALEGADAVVNLAGSPVSVRWTSRGRAEILASRLGPTATLAAAIGAMSDGPRVLVQGSAIGIYGDRGESALDERSAPGSGFLAGVVQEWEAAARPAEQSGARVAFARTGLVLSATGGALGRLLPLIRLGLGGPLGSGRQWWSWISLRDEVRAIEHLLTAEVAGPVNLTAPHPARQREVAAELARACHRPAIVRAPGWALRLAIGGFAGEILASQRVAPRALLESGFRHEHSVVSDAVSDLINGASDDLD